MSELNPRHRRVDSEATHTPTRDEAAAAKIEDIEAQLAAAQSEAANKEAWGIDDPIMAFDANGVRTDFTGYEDWRDNSREETSSYDPTTSLNAEFSNFEANGALKTELEPANLNELSYMQLVGAARKMNEIGDIAGKQEILDAIDDKLQLQGVEEGTDDKQRKDSFDRFVAMIDTPSVKKAETAGEQSTPAAEAEPANEEGLDGILAFARERGLDPALANELGVEVGDNDSEASDEGDDSEALKPFPAIMGPIHMPEGEPEVATPENEPAVVTPENTVKSAEDGESVEPNAATDEPEKKYGFFEELKDTRNPLTFLMNRMQRLRDKRQEKREAMTQEERDKQDKRVKILAIGTLATAAAAVALDKFGGFNAIGDFINGDNMTPDAGIIGDLNGSARDVGSADAGPVEVPAPSSESYSEAAHTAVRGEGWYQTMKEMGIPSAERATLLAKAGPELVDAGYAYAENGEYFISSTGNLPQNVLDLIESNR